MKRLLIILFLAFPIFTEAQFIINPYVYASSCDADAQRFIDSAGITDVTQKDAICYLVDALKDSSIWDRFWAIYPVVGGTATTHKWNLINPTNSNAAYRLTFSGGWTHSSTGILPNGTNANANTNFNTNSKVSYIDSMHISFYSGTNNTIESTDMADGLFSEIFTYSGGRTYASMNCSEQNVVASSATNGLYICSRIASGSFNLYIKNVKTNKATASSSTSGTNIYLSSYGASNYWSSRELRFATIGKGLNDADARKLYNIIQAYQTLLSRQI